MFNIIRTASAVAFLVVALAASVAKPISSVSVAAANSEFHSVMEVASARANPVRPIPVLPVYIVTADAPRSLSANGSVSVPAKVRTAALSSEVRRVLPRLRLDVPYYSFGGSAGTRTAE